MVVAVLAVGLAAAVVLTSRSGGHIGLPAQRVSGLPETGALKAAPHRPPAAALRAARTFLSGYLAYLYGQGTAAHIRAAAPGLVAVLARRRPAVSPAAHRLHPVVVGFGAREAGGNVLHLTAVVSDGIARYPLRVLMVNRAGGWQTAALANPE